MHQSSSSPTKIQEMHKYYMYWNIEKNKSRRAHCIGSSLLMTILEMHKYYCIGILKKKHLDEHNVFIFNQESFEDE